MDHIREIDVPETDVGTEECDEELERDIASIDLGAYLAQREQVFHQSRQPTYAEATVTGLTKSMGEIPEWSANGRGQSFGVIHKGLEEVGKGLAMSELPAYVQYLCQVEGVAEKDAGDALPILQEVLDSELWRRSQRAKRRLFEIPIMMHQRNGDQRHFTQPNRQYPKQPPRH